MLTPVTATIFHRPMGVGKTAPSLVTCAQKDGDDVELIVKFAGGCEAGIGSLLREAVGALMAADLDLPVPEPFLVKVEADFVATIPEADDRYRQAKRNAEASLGWNFGSKKLPPGFSTMNLPSARKGCFSGKHRGKKEGSVFRRDSRTLCAMSSWMNCGGASRIFAGWAGHLMC